ncbi:hypothetical protein YPPY32_2769 [Yersinia pestis PY-32]|nr:hypothetical protein YPPY32_2769 [Yersinia pestis PY-32]
MQHIFIFHAVSNCTGSVNQFIFSASYPKAKLGKNQFFPAQDRLSQVQILLWVRCWLVLPAPIRATLSCRTYPQGWPTIMQVISVGWQPRL